MADFKIPSNDDLIKTVIHGMDQNAFIVTEDKMNSFNSYSLEFQIYLSLFSIDLGFFINSLENTNSVGFWVSLIIGFILGIFLSMHYFKFRKTRDNLFVKTNTKNELLEKS